MDYDKKISAILIAQNYGIHDELAGCVSAPNCVWVKDSTGAHIETIEIYLNTLIGRRQADAVEDWLHIHKPALLIECHSKLLPPVPYNGRQKRLDRLKWCIENLIKYKKED